MSDPKHPTNPLWELFDPLINPPPKGVILLLANEGGVLIPGKWYAGAIAWGYKPGIPKSVKDRLNRRKNLPAPSLSINPH